MRIQSKILYILAPILLGLVLFLNFSSGTQGDPWKPEQLLAPAALASTISHPEEKQPLIICVGPGAVIPHSIDAGPAKEQDNLTKLKGILEKTPRDKEVVIYCGCCPFDRCPNVRPAFALLMQMKFTQARLLNLSTNIRTDWIAKGYPQNK